MKPQNLFLALSLAGGVLIAFITPPFQVPDESAHFFRAYAISNGQLDQKRVGERVGQHLPAALVQFARKYNYLVMNQGSKTSRSFISETRNTRIVEHEKVFTDFAFTGVYWPVSYIPQAAGIMLGRLLTDRVLDLLYVARIANLLAASLLGFAAITITPSFRWVLTLLALMPMTVFLRSSVSPDTLVIALAFLVFALSLRVLVRATATDLVTLTVVTAALALMKPYGPIGWIALAKTDVWRKPRFRIWGVTLVLVTIAATTLLAWHSTIFRVSPPWNTSPEDQLKSVLSHPFAYARLATTDFIREGRWYGRQFVGQLGWLDIALPTWLVVGYGTLLILIALFDGFPDTTLSIAQRLWITAIVLALFLVITLSQYLVWTPLYSGTIRGIQGRYFLPVAPAALLLLTTRTLAFTRIRIVIPFLIIGGVITALVLTVICLVDRYYYV